MYVHVERLESAKLCCIFHSLLQYYQHTLMPTGAYIAFCHPEGTKCIFHTIISSWYNCMYVLDLLYVDIRIQ